MLRKSLFLLFSLKVILIKSQCSGIWSDTTSYNYLCANGHVTQIDLGANVCPTISQATYNFSAPVPAVVLNFSAFGTSGFIGQSRMAIFLNAVKIDLLSACQITLGCQNPSGTYSISSGCLVDSWPGMDGGISGTIVLKASTYSLTSITSLGVATSEPGGSGTIFEVTACSTSCIDASIYENAFSNSVSLKPIPSNDKIEISFTKRANYIITINNISGLILEQVEIVNENKFQLNKTTLGEGIFFITIQERNGGVLRRKIIFN